MSLLVVNGAAVRCSLGTAPSVLTVLPGPVAAGSPASAVAVQTDVATGANLSTFGMCTSPANPAVQAATTAASGIFTPAPCVPAVAAPWALPSTAVAVNGIPAITQLSTCTCTWLGVVSVQQPGQVSAATV